MNYLDDLVVRAAYGRWVPYDHRIRRNSTQWFWVRTSDAAQLSAPPRGAAPPALATITATPTWRRR
ncbi:hypothetical protein AB0368_35845 [Actinoplanes sp. NPDC051475]|uniref:hypothetical protein n=1 Tax=Actinoplanes sp. NPDC051475 TaxID=3157225 RepID=UPI00344C88A7